MDALLVWEKKGGALYSLDEYQRGQRKCTKLMAARSARMLEYVTEAMTQTERRKGKDPALRVKSYLLQEAEAVSRAAKVAWCEAHGLRVVNLQHDGILVSPSLELGSNFT